jgi:hypothetical protein
VARRLVEAAIRAEAIDKEDSMPEHTSWAKLEADLAFSAVTRRRRWAALLGRAVRGLQVYDETGHRQAGPRGVTEIPLEAIAGTTEPNRAEQFDGHFRPKPITRSRWERVWMAVQEGVALPPISVVRIGDAYAIRDGHHRVSVAKALGARTIAARVA